MLSSEKNITAHQFDQSNFDPSFSFSKELDTSISEPDIPTLEEDASTPAHDTSVQDIEILENPAPASENVPDDKDLSPFVKWLKNKNSANEVPQKPKKKKAKASVKKTPKTFKKSSQKDAKAAKKVAKASKKTQIVLDNEVISETLADLLLQQGHKAAARDMYDKLGLKYPEKSSYFADRIEKIKE